MSLAYTCKCYDGFTGPHCDKVVCPRTAAGGICNGHGTCDTSIGCVCDGTPAAAELEASAAADEKARAAEAANATSSSGGGKKAGEAGEKNGTSPDGADVVKVCQPFCHEEMTKAATDEKQKEVVCSWDKCKACDECEGYNNATTNSSSSKKKAGNATLSAADKKDVEKAETVALANATAAGDPTLPKGMGAMWSGSSCTVLLCAKGTDGKQCNSRGNCVAGACVCDKGYKGESCSGGLLGSLKDGECVKGSATDKETGLMSTPAECTGPAHGRCDAEKSQCICEAGWKGMDCNTATCPSHAKNRLKCGGK